MSGKFKVLVVSDSEEHDVPDGWFVLTAFPLRTGGVQATIGVVLMQISGGRRWTPEDYKRAAAVFEGERP